MVRGPFISPASDVLHGSLTKKCKNRNLFSNYAVNITVLKTLWKLLKSLKPQGNFEVTVLYEKNYVRTFSNRKRKRRACFAL